MSLDLVPALASAQEFFVGFGLRPRVASTRIQGAFSMLARWSFLSRLVFLASCLSLAAPAAAQVKPRFMIAFDSSGSMVFALDGNTTYGDGVGRPAVVGDPAAQVSNGVFYGCGTTAGVDRNCDGIPNESRMSIAKSAVRNMIGAFGDVEWALARFGQTNTADVGQYEGTDDCSTGNSVLYGNPQCNTGSVNNSSCNSAIMDACEPGQGTNPSMREWDTGDFAATINYTGSCDSGNVLVGFPGIASTPFASLDNRHAILKWMDNVETNFNSSTTSGNFCNHSGSGDCELRPSGSTPLGGILSAANSYMTPVRTADVASACRPYSVILLTDGSEQCSTNPSGVAATLLTGGIRTYVVGLSTTSTEQASLNAIAASGGTTAAYFANNQTELAAALSEIVNDSLIFETCNGLDDDCDTRIDEDLPPAQPDFGMPVNTQSSSLFCDGEANRTATQNTQVRARSDVSDTFPLASAITTPQVCGRVTDTCENPGVDDDCDGATDENGTLNACGRCPGAPDLCDGIDNDCDTRYDEGTTGVPFGSCPQICTADVPCGSDVGACQTGFYRCQGGVLNTTLCDGQVTGGPEICDEIDNDCNGIVDDPAVLSRACPGWPAGYAQGGTSICSRGTQFCARTNAGELEDASGYRVNAMGQPICAGQVLPDDREICDALDHDCNGNNFTCTQGTCTSPSLAFVGNTCGTGVGICVGQLVCDQNGDPDGTPPELVCNAPSPGTETCNNIDDDCDGRVDEMAVAGNDLGGAAGGPVAGFCGTVATDNGACNRGRFACTNGFWSCAGAQGPSTEICNGLDDDCDNLTDTADPNLTDPRIGQQCGTTIGECEPGTSICSAGDIQCTPVRGPVTEDCNGRDDDCDYLTDENLPDNNMDGVQDVVSCGTSTGACEPGRLACTPDTDVMDGFDYNCVGGITASPEVCDNEDNDCDGVTDECTGDHASAAWIACNGDPLGMMGPLPTNLGLGAGGGDTCGTNVAPCTTGKTKCIADTVTGNADTTEAGFICVGNTNGSPEICDGADQDCDTKIDEDIDPDIDERLGDRCGEDEVGDCRIDVDMDDVPNDPDDLPCGQCRFGLTDCIAGDIACVDGIGPDEYEACNNTDDDCDGETDECVDDMAPGCLGEVDPMSPIGDACGQDDPQACGSGALTCTDGSLECENVPTGGDELCNGMDEDCDTFIDEDFELGDTCGSSVGECEPGILICDPDGSGGTICQDPVLPIDEVCDGLDNDCDNAIDEDTNSGEPCGSDVGECEKGTLECVSGRERCVGEKVPGFEVCDCLDNDCDDKIDEETDGESLCGNTGACVMCQCALPCADGVEFGTGCPQGKSPVEQDGECYCVGSLCERTACATETIVEGDETRCAPDSDVAGKCECRNNECTHPCAGVICDDGLVCDQTSGRCAEATCLLAQLACDEGLRCSRVDETLQCVVDECAGVTCDGDEACRLGECVKSCGRVMCGATERCEDGECLAAPCNAVTCRTGEACDPDDGACVEAGECVGMPCLQGQVCDPIGGECNEDPCGATRCPSDERCDSATGQCTLRCAPQLVYCDEQCLDPESSRMHCGASADCMGDNAGEVCAEGLVCSRGSCSDSCEDGLANCGGECVDGKTDELHCGAEANCMDDNEGTTCQPQYSCVDGTCRPPVDPNPPDGEDENPIRRVIASGGGGCTCSVPGSTQDGGEGGEGSESKRAGLSLGLVALGLLLLNRRKRFTVPVQARPLIIALSFGVLSSVESGCKVDTFCINCGDESGEDGGGGVNGGGAGGDLGGGVGGVSGNAGGDGGPGGAGAGGESGGGAGGASGGDGGPVGDGGCATSELCNGLDDDCDDKIDEGAALGGIDITSDQMNCGACGAQCLLPHAFNRCEDSECKIDRAQGENGCDIGYFDHDGMESNGCEYRCNKTNDTDTACDQVDNDCDKEIDEDVDFQSDPEHCGTCARCILRNVNNAACEAGVCVVGDDSTCAERYADEDGLDANGCEYRCPVFPTTGEQCNGRDDDCDGETDEGDLAADVRIGVECGDDDGVCVAGETVCNAGAVLCQGATGGSVEICDGLDNDCDGVTDTDHPDVGDPCGTSVPGSQCRQGTLQVPVGGCTGGVEQALVCVGSVAASPEVCDGLDNDCDGRADEESGTPARRPGAGQMCTNTPTGVMIVGTDPAGLCTAGETFCVSGTLVCRNEVGPEPVELCDNQDHDCVGGNLNGFPDIGGGIASTGPDPDMGDPCGIDTGACSFGSIRCNLNSASKFCFGGQGPVAETCNAIDDDCDGRIDERPSPTGFLTGENVACVTNSNGTVNTSPPATASRGECDTGRTVCSAGTIRCSGEQGPRPELCDDEDWDCDGNAINGVAVTDPAVGDPCGRPTVGECRRGTTACVAVGADFAIQCQNAIPATTNPALLPQAATTNLPETACDGRDNDCDGAADEGSATAYPGAGGTCCDNGLGCCPGNSGTMRCDAARVHCVYPGGTEFPGTEVCGNGPGGTTDTGLSLSDDDCDGTVDEGYDLDNDVNNCGGCGIQCAFNPGVTMPRAVLVCDDGDCEIGACIGSFVDINDQYGDGCEAACNFTGNEICDGQDNDCNGVTDDTTGLPQQVCIPRRVGVCANVPQLLTLGPSCDDGMLFCDVQAVATAGFIPNYQAVETRCDGLDNDCDGTVDDGYNVGAICNNGAQGECREDGVIACTSLSTAACNAPSAGTATTEVCNGLDDNCDGTVDNFAVPGTGGSAVGNVEVVNLGAAEGNVLVMAYEASRPNATATSAGTLTNKPCSVEGVKPWTNVTWAEASAACCALNANGLCQGGGLGWRLCDAATIQSACEGPQVDPCTWGYSTTAACDHVFNSTTYQNTCHGAESMEDGDVTCADMASSCSTVTGDTDFPACYANWTGGPISDLSGNIQEWTNTARDVTENVCTQTCTTYTGPAVNATADTGNTSSTITVPATAGTASRIRLANVTGEHGEFDNLEFYLTNPSATEATILTDECGNGDDWDFDIRENATNSAGGGTFCGLTPYGGGQAFTPDEAFTVFNGQAVTGNWVLRVNDGENRSGSVVGEDRVRISGWQMEVCSTTCAAVVTPYHEIRGGSYNDVEAGRTCGFDFEIGPNTFRFPTTGFRCCRY
jgi:hypothetical protein